MEHAARSVVGVLRPVLPPARKLATMSAPKSVAVCARLRQHTSTQTMPLRLAPMQEGPTPKSATLILVTLTIGISVPSQPAVSRAAGAYRPVRCNAVTRPPTLWSLMIDARQVQNPRHSKVAILIPVLPTPGSPAPSQFAALAVEEVRGRGVCDASVASMVLM